MRPTESRVKKAVFDILGDIAGLSFLDLFAGGGAVGIKALSCSASKVVFVEKNRQYYKRIKHNLSSVFRSAGLPVCQFVDRRTARRPDRTTILNMDVSKAIPEFYKENEAFDIIFLDPPYYKDMAKKILQILDVYDILTSSGLVLVQHYKRDILPESLKNLALYKHYKYGDTVLSLYQKARSQK